MFIGGLSMGAFGAFKIGIKYRHIFSAIAAHSSLTNILQMEKFVEENVENYLQEDKTEEDVFLTIQKYKDQLLVLSFDCGLSDTQIGHNRILHQQLIDQNIPHDYEEYQGAHEWSYWEEHITDTILFFARNIK